MSDNKKILIVDDEQDIVETLKFMLEAQGYECFCAYDGEAGLNLAKEIMPDLMILDVMMPKINGYKISRLLKYDTKYKDIPGCQMLIFVCHVFQLLPVFFQVLYFSFFQ